MCGQGSAPTEKHSRHRLVGVVLDSTCFWFLGSFPDDKAPAGSWAGSGPTERILKVSDRSIPQYLQLYKAFFPSLRLPGRRSPPDITLRRFDRCGAAADADSIAMTPNLYPPSADPQSTHLLTTATAPPRRSCDARDRLDARELGASMRRCCRSGREISGGGSFRGGAVTVQRAEEGGSGPRHDPRGRATCTSSALCSRGRSGSVEETKLIRHSASWTSGVRPSSILKSERKGDVV